ncbi:MAG: PQQ-like beta-propeller repeat protein [Verrucomicrobiaceae bacterium]|nr:PQQ-like beta-propeller repeat protein [Verrucomicrobiaceae bacterium]
MKFVILLCLACGCPLVRADDWPQFRGVHRSAVWNETGIMETFPKDGLRTAWKAEVGAGLSSAIVANGRVFAIGSSLEKPKASECVRCLDETTGKELWRHAYDAAYPDWAFDPKQNSGPNATPIVQDGKLHTLGQMGDLFCLDAMTGAVLWHRSLMKDYGTKEFTGGTPSPLIEGKLLIQPIGVEKGPTVVAFDKDTGKEVWRALDDPWTYSSPLVISAGGVRQFIVWTPKSVTSLDPETGKVWWREPVDTTNYYGSATPVHVGDKLVLSGMMFQLDAAKPAAKFLWPESKSPVKVVLGACSIPWFNDGCVFTGKNNGHLVCLDANDGKVLWDNDQITSKAGGPAIHITPNGDSALLFTDQGNLIRARLDRAGYHEMSRVHVVDPVHPFAGRNLIWPPPSYANGHIFVHNGTELVRVSLKVE